MSWQPLAPSNPVPGDPSVSTDASTYYAEVAEAMQGAYDALGVIGDTDTFTSDAVAELREKADEVRGEVRNARTRYVAASEALSTYATAHQEAQDAAADLLRRAQEAEQAAAEAGTAVADAQDGYDEAVVTARSTGEPVDSYASQLLFRRVESRDAADSALQSVIGELDGVLETWRSAARTAANAIDVAVEQDNLNDGWWEKWGSQVANFLSTWAGRIAMWAGIAALVLGWVPILGQILAVVALVTTVVALVADIALAVSGESDWTNAILGLVAVASFGIGRVVGRAGKALAARGLTQGAARQSRVAARIPAGSRYANPRSAAHVWSNATRHVRSVPYSRWNPVSWVRSGAASFSGLSGRSWVMNMMGHSQAARAHQALSSAAANPQFVKGATGFTSTLSRLGTLDPRVVGSFGSALVPYSMDIAGNTTLLVRDVRTWGG